MGYETDLIDRDPNFLNDHVKVYFDDVLGEPDGTHSVKCLWKCSHDCFNCCKGCWYKFLTLLCGIPVSICWGCHFAYIIFLHVWCVTPSMRTFVIFCGCCQKVYGTCVHCYVQPWALAYSYVFSNIRITKTSG